MGVYQYFKKGQVQNLESIIVTMVIVILLVLGVYFYFKFFAKNLQQTGLDLSEIKGTVLLDRITSLPEFTCGINCVDASKLLASKNVINSNKLYYKNLFGDKFGIKSMIIEQVYPKPRISRECLSSDFNSGDYPLNCRSYVVYENEVSGNSYNISSVISIYYPNKDEYMLGKVILGVYR